MLRPGDLIIYGRTGVCRVEKIPLFAKENGMTSVALTDHGVMYGAVAFYR